MQRIAVTGDHFRKPTPKQNGKVFLTQLWPIKLTFSIKLVAIVSSCIWTTFIAMPVTAGFVSFTGSPYEQNFNGLPNSGSVSKATSGPYDFASDLNLHTLSGWQMWKYEGSATESLLSTSGSTHGMRSYGNDSDRALGAQATSTGEYCFGVILKNATGSAIDHFYLEYTGEQWRSQNSSTKKELSFDYAVGANLQNITSAPPGGTTGYHSVEELDFSKLVWSSNGLVDGNTHSIKISYKVENIDWQADEFLILRWTDTLVSSGIHPNPSLAIDDLKFSVDIAHAPEPSALVMAGMAASGLLFLMRKHAPRRRTA